MYCALLITGGRLSTNSQIKLLLTVSSERDDDIDGDNAYKECGKPYQSCCFIEIKFPCNHSLISTSTEE